MFVRSKGVGVYVVTEVTGSGHNFLGVYISLDLVWRGIDEYFGGYGSYDIVSRYEIKERGVEYIVDISFGGKSSRVLVRRCVLGGSVGSSLVRRDVVEVFFWVLMVLLFFVSFFNFMVCLE